MPHESERGHQSPRTLPPPDQRNQPLFSLGQIVATPEVLRHFETNGFDPLQYLRQHSHGVWGDVPAEDARANDEAVQNGLRILSSYRIAGERVWIITEAAPREYSTLLFPSQY